MTDVAGWRAINWEDIPSREDLAKATLALLESGMTNSDRMRDRIRRDNKLILSRSTGKWNNNPTDKFVNEHAWVLEDLVVRGLIENVGTKEYRLK